MGADGAKGETCAVRGDKAHRSEEAPTSKPFSTCICPSSTVPGYASLGSPPNRSAEHTLGYQTMANSIRVSLPDDDESRPGAEDDSCGSAGGSPAQPRPKKRRRIPVACGACRSKKSRVRRSSCGAFEFRLGEREGKKDRRRERERVGDRKKRDDDRGQLV